MRSTGTLVSWNDSRGYGFIAPRDGAPALFVHASAFPHGPSRPTVGELITYELEDGPDGRPQAVRAVRRALDTAAAPESRMARARQQRAAGSPIRWLIGLVFVATVLAYAYTAYQQRDHRVPPAAEAGASQPGQAPAASGTTPR